MSISIAGGVKSELHKIIEVNIKSIVYEIAEMNKATPYVFKSEFTDHYRGYQIFSLVDDHLYGHKV